ncbi:ABC transporter substrate-binding protein [Acinetobacter sp. 194]|uniref:ABC transporter substrate-binding protein n=1 Tax=Acinetobacter shaoyimingii TaxID=2715164 RepID=UPI001408098B|nr:ABC transporter substrate-binding protein [Acinetobacter shaoyimingii]NHB58514.1 ABC transporter substrate-binding protein [Acinetobacter shaoyimingii]
MNALEKTDIQLGYIPLLDCVALLWAHHQGYFAQHGLNVTLVKEPSWASLRDRLAFGFLDTAHCLSAMLPAAATGEDQLGIPLQTSLVLSTNRAFISLSQQLCHALNITPDQSAEDISLKITQAISNGQKIQLAHVYKQSIHHYCLREWLALSNEAIAKQYRLSTLPPPYMVEAISSHLIDGFCVGEPWNIQAELQGLSRVIAESSQIIPEIADKVLATTHEWAIQHPHTLNALQKAILHAQSDLKNSDNLDAIWDLLEKSDIIRFHCSEHVHVEKYYKLQQIIHSFADHSVPKLSDFEWILSQMNKWEDLKLEHNQIQAIAQSCIGRHIPHDSK